MRCERCAAARVRSRAKGGGGARELRRGGASMRFDVKIVYPINEPLSTDAIWVRAASAHCGVGGGLIPAPPPASSRDVRDRTPQALPWAALLEDFITMSLRGNSSLYFRAKIQDSKIQDFEPRRAAASGAPNHLHTTPSQHTLTRPRCTQRRPPLTASAPPYPGAPALVEKPGNTRSLFSPHNSPRLAQLLP